MDYSFTSDTVKLHQSRLKTYKLLFKCVEIRIAHFHLNHMLPMLLSNKTMNLITILNVQLKKCDSTKIAHLDYNFSSVSISLTSLYIEQIICFNAYLLVSECILNFNRFFKLPNSRFYVEAKYQSINQLKFKIQRLEQDKNARPHRNSI